MLKVHSNGMCVCYSIKDQILLQRVYATNTLKVKKWECSGYASCGFYGNLNEVVFVSLE